jgi:hypothetical protein
LHYLKNLGYFIRLTVAVYPAVPSGIRPDIQYICIQYLTKNFDTGQYGQQKISLFSADFKNVILP